MKIIDDPLEQFPDACIVQGDNFTYHCHSREEAEQLVELYELQQAAKRGLLEIAKRKRQS